GASILAISGNNSVRVFVIYDGVTATISGITIKSGSDRYGAGVTNSGTLTLTNCTISDNHASIWGGGIYNIFGTLTLANSTVSGNFATWAGGGTLSLTALTMINDTLSGNSALYGGGVFNDNKGMLTVKNTILAISTGGNCYLASAVPTSGGHNLSDDNTCTSF